MARVGHVEGGQRIAVEVAGDVVLLNDGDVLADRALYVKLAVDVDGHGLGGVDLAALFHGQIVDVASVGLAVAAVRQNDVPDGLVRQGDVDGVADLLVRDVVLCADLVVVGDAGLEVVAGGVRVEDSAVLHARTVIVEMVAVGGGDRAVHGGSVEGDVEILELVIDVVPDVAGVFAVGEGGVGVVDSRRGGRLRRLVAKVVHGEGGVARIARVVGLNKLDQRTAPDGVGGEVDLGVVEDDVGIAVVGRAGLDLDAGLADVEGGVGDGDRTTGVLLGHDTDVAGLKQGVGVESGGVGRGHDLDLVAAVELHVVEAIPHAGVGVGDIAGAARNVAVGHAADGLGVEVGLGARAVFHDLDRACAGGRVGNVERVGANLVIAVAGVGGEHAPAGGDDQRVGVDALSCAEDVGGADNALKTKRERSALHHGDDERVIFLLGVVGFLRIDDGVVDTENAVAVGGSRRADNALGEDGGILDGHVSRALGKHHGGVAGEVVRTVAVAGDAHVGDGVLGGVNDNAVEERAVGVKLAAGNALFVIGGLGEQGGDSLVVVNAVFIDIQRGAVGVLGSVAGHVHELGHLGAGSRAGGRLKGVGAVLERRAVLHIVENVVLVAVDNERENAAVFGLDYAAVREGDGGDVGRSGRTVDGVVLRGGGGNVVVAVGDRFDGQTGLAGGERGDGKQHTQCQNDCECLFHVIPPKIFALGRVLTYIIYKPCPSVKA